MFCGMNVNNNKIIDNSLHPLPYYVSCCLSPKNNSDAHCILYIICGNVKRNNTTL
jgi:hypothetical protein